MIYRNKYNLKILIGLLLILIFLFQIPLIANSNNISFLNDPSLSQSDNVEIMSESPYITKWDFYNGTGVGAVLYNETFGDGDYWDLYGVSERYFKYIPTTYLMDNSSITDDIEYSGFYFDLDFDTEHMGITYDGEYFWVVGYSTDEVYKYNYDGTYTGFSFDTSVQILYPYAITWDGSDLWVTCYNHERAYKYNTAGVYSSVSFDLHNPVQYGTGMDWDGTHFWITAGQYSDFALGECRYTAVGVYVPGSYFGVGAQTTQPYGVTWDGTHLWVVGRNPNDEVYKYTTAGVYTESYFDVSGQSISPHGVEWDGTYFWVVGGFEEKVFRYSRKYNISKNYHGTGYAYMQTNITETLTLKSPDTLTLSLNSSQVIHIRFNTTSTNRIDFNLKNSGDILKSYILSIQGNTNFNTKDAYLSVDKDYSVDQLEFTGIFDDTKNLIVDLVEIYVEEPVKRVYLDPDGYKQFYLDQPVNYTVKIFEKDILRDTQNFTTSSELQTLFFYKTEERAVYLTYYDSNNEYLSFNKYITYANYTLGDILFSDKRMSDNILYVDKDTLIQFNIYDSFNALIRTYETYEETFIDITLNVYSLKIKNEATKYASYSLKNVGTDITKSGNIFPEEIIEFSISTGNYIFDYTNQENGQFYSINISLTGHQILILNTTYYDVYFLILSNDGEAVSENDIDLYINGTRSNLGFNTIESRYINVTIRDVFNFVIYSGIIDTDGITQCVIYLDLYSLNILNLYTFDDILVIASEIKYESFIGHYPATYSFEDEADGSVPSGWSSLAGTQEMISDLDKHSKVVQMIGDDSNMKNDFDAQISGTIELWVYVPNDVDHNNRIYIFIYGLKTGGGYGHGIYLSSSYNDLRYVDLSGDYHIITDSFTFDEWHHIRVDFDCWTERADYWFDGELKVDNGEFYREMDNILSIQLRYYADNSDLDGYYDAIGYSWDANYYIGDNMYWQWYFATYDFENDDISTSGHYYGVYSFGDISPEELGHYYGTYSFKGETGKTGTDIDWVDTDNGDYSIKVSSLWQDHKDVLELADTGAGIVRSYHIFDDGGQTYGTIELYFGSDDVSKATTLYIDGNSGNYYENCLRLMMDTSKFQYHDGTWNNIQSVASNNFYLLKIKFNMSGWDLWINGILKSGDSYDYGYSGTPSDLERIVVSTHGDDADYSTYFDAFGYSWDPLYNISHNINPFDLSSYFEHKWNYNGTLNASYLISCSIGGHNYILNISSFNNSASIWNEFDSSQTSGTVEYWLYGNDTTNEFRIELWNNTDWIIGLKVNNSNLYYHNSTEWVNAGGLSNDQWYQLRIDFDCDDNDYNLYLDGTYIEVNIPFRINTTSLEKLWFKSYDKLNIYSYYFDAIGYSWEDYLVGDNINPYGRPSDLSGFIDTYGVGWETSVNVSGEFDTHKKFISLNDNSAGKRINIFDSFDAQTSGTIEFWVKFTDNSKHYAVRISGTSAAIYFYWDTDGDLKDKDGVVMDSYLADTWYHIKLDFNCGTDTFDIYINQILIGDNKAFVNAVANINKIEFLTDLAQTDYSFFIDAIAYSWDTTGMYYYWDDYYFIYDISSDYVVGHNLIPEVIPSGDWHYGDVNVSEVIAHEFFEEFRFHANHNYTISIYYTNGTFIESRNIRLLDNGQIERFGTPSKTCFLSYADQRGIYLPFYNYKTYIDGVLIYQNIIIRQIGTNLSIEIKDRYGISIKNSSYVVVDGDNFIAITLTMHSLKIYNQQEVFNWVNVTRDPNYYESEMYWSEWLAPNEITEYMLFEGYYKVNITRNEEGSSSVYDYHLVGDDMLLVTSDNTITNTIINLQNVNTTLGNQITNVEINITNQNSAINNSVVNVNINLSNVNSTLGDLLITQSIQITNIENNLTSLYIFTNNSFINLNSSINTYFINIENNIISINDTISNLIIGIDNDIILINTSISALIAGVSTDLSLINTSVSTLILDINNDIILINQSISNLVIDIDNNVALINGTISTLIMDIGNDLMIMNSMIDTSFFFLNTTILEIGNNITANTIFLNNSIFVTGNWINDSRIAILNNLALINNTMMTGINQIYTSVYLINNSIYTAVIDLGTSLTLENNKITGNLSIILQQNDFLTAIYNKTMFSELLNWSGVGYNFSIMEDRIDVFKFINDYRNQSVEIFLRYQDKVESMVLSAQNSLDQWLPKEDVEYRLKSVATGEYLSEWEDLTNRTVNFGFYETEIDPGPIMVSFTNIVMLFFFFTLFAVIIVVLYIKFRKTVENYPLVYRSKKKKRTSTYNSRVYR